MSILEWRVVDEPQYDGFLAANHGLYVFCIEYDPNLDVGAGFFWLEITLDRTTLELSRHRTPYDAMKAARDWLTSMTRVLD